MIKTIEHGDQNTDSGDAQMPGFATYSDFGQIM